jgi:HK97 family phage portal protein
VNITKTFRNLGNRIEEWAFQKAYNFVFRSSAAYAKEPKGSSSIFADGDSYEATAAFEAIRKSSWLYYCIHTIGTSAAGLPFGEFKKGPTTKGGDYVLDEDSIITKLIYSPNPIQTKDEFIEAIFFSLEATGLLFIEVVGTKKAPVEMYVLDPRNMKIEKDSKKYVSRYIYTVNGKEIPYQPEEIIFHRYHNPNNPYGGLAPATPAGDAINSDILANEYNNEYFHNSAIPAGTLETETRMNDTEVDQLRMQWEKGHKGKKRRHRVAILWGGLKFKATQRSPRDMEFIKQKESNKLEILSTFGVPEDMGLDKEKRKMFWMQTMRPRLRALARRLTMEFGLDGFKHKVMFDLTDVEALQDDQEIKSRIAFNLAKSYVMVPDEIRRIFYKLPPLANGTGATIWVPTNLVPASLQMNGPVAAQPTTSTGKPGKPGGPNAQPKPEGQKPGANDGKPAGKELEEITQDELVKLYHAHWDQFLQDNDLEFKEMSYQRILEG